MANGSFEPIAKPGVRVRDPEVLANCERRWCEYCGIYASEHVVIHAHHEKTRGAGGGDTRENVIGLCVRAGFGGGCHTKRHNGRITHEQIVGRLIELGRIEEEEG